MMRVSFRTAMRKTAYPLLILGGLVVAALAFSSPNPAKVDYEVHFGVGKQEFLAGEPVFCRFTIKNTGSEILQFAYRPTTRILNPELEQEPRFHVTDSAGKPLYDPAPQPCGGEKGSGIYGTSTLPPGQVHEEHWLLNQWARISQPGVYHVRAERRLPLLTVDPVTHKPSDKPAAFALAIDELTFQIRAPKPGELESAFEPYVKQLEDLHDTNPLESLYAVSTLPQPFLLPVLRNLALASTDQRRWDRSPVLEGLARLGTPEAWAVISDVAQGKGATGKSSESADASLRSYALQLLGEKANPSFMPIVIQLAAIGSESLQGDALRTLGFFRNPQASQVLFERLHSSRTEDRMNAILGLKNLGTPNVVPALIAMLRDPESQVRQVANFALQRVTGHKFPMMPDASAREAHSNARRWEDWWQENAGRVSERDPAPCQDW